MFKLNEQIAMKRAIELASRAGKKVFPNPGVGAVILKPSGEVVSEGYHAIYGGPHAEVNALQNAGDVNGCTMVVTLEPCCHFGKTPPCVDAIVTAGIKRVVIGLEDPNPVVSGNGIKYLLAKNIDVEVGLFQDEVKRLNAIYLHNLSFQRSFLHLKMATTLDGRVAAKDGSSRWITSEESRARVHAFRHSAHAVLVGRVTAIMDDPELTVRAVKCADEDQPVRIILASKELPASLKLFNTKGRTVIATNSDISFPDGIEVWRETGSLHDLLKRTRAEGLGEVLCEGGRTLATSLLKEQLVDRLSIFTAPALLGDSGMPLINDLGIDSIDGILRLRNTVVTQIGEDTLTEGQVVYRSN